MILPILFLLFAISGLSARDQQSAQYRVMTFNIRQNGVTEKDTANSWPNRLPRITTILSEIQPDIIGMQEPLKEQIADLKTNLSEYTQIGDSRGSCWWNLDTDEYNPIWFKADRFTLKDSGTFHIDGNPSKIERILNQKKYGLLSRICTWALLHDKITNAHVYVFNTHLDHMFTEARRFGLSNILKFIKTNRIDTWPVLLMGDFNTNVEGDIKELLDAAQFKNTKVLAQTVEGPENTYTGYGYHQECLIDHILALGGVNASRHVTIPEGQDGYPSDHRPVFVDLKIS